MFCLLDGPKIKGQRSKFVRTTFALQETVAEKWGTSSSSSRHIALPTAYEASPIWGMEVHARSRKVSIPE
ncbi:hypothetical protein PHLCEN_2v7578 [Hermanssonia centrifuga]|uniref:Uncharacterized protein n=1 Tax=Hermanssonia centrifuga TaxID=98765 RepID=A0A2R6NW68_9APHY|nr:hypothetical protein PHLCEN_2v7578 [Hermanssonia centrifuga]